MDWEPRDFPENNVTDVHPLKELVTLVAGIAAATIILTLAIAFTLDIGMRALPAAWEARLFDGLWSDLDEVDDERHAAAVRLVDELALDWPENPYTFQVFILDSPDPNAFALPGGAIGVTRGLLDSVESENELAFVLAHEIGHFSGRHHLRGISRTLAVTVVLGAVTGGASGTMLTQWVSEVTQLGFAREHEEEADRFGLDLVEKRFGHVNGATGFFQKLPDANAGTAGRLGAWFATHPVSPKRISDLRRLARDRGWRASGELTPLDPSFYAE